MPANSSGTGLVLRTKVLPCNSPDVNTGGPCGAFPESPWGSYSHKQVPLSPTPGRFYIYEGILMFTGYTQGGNGQDGLPKPDRVLTGLAALWLCYPAWVTSLLASPFDGAHCTSLFSLQELQWIAH